MSDLTTLKAPRRFFNQNAIQDAKHDARMKLGNQNKYNPGSESWRQYETAYEIELAIEKSYHDV